MAKPPQPEPISATVMELQVVDLLVEWIVRLTRACSERFTLGLENTHGNIASDRQGTNGKVRSRCRNGDGHERRQAYRIIFDASAMIAPQPPHELLGAVRIEPGAVDGEEGEIMYAPAVLQCQRAVISTPAAYSSGFMKKTGIERSIAKVDGVSSGWLAFAERWTLPSASRTRRFPGD